MIHIVEYKGRMDTEIMSSKINLIVFLSVSRCWGYVKQFIVHPTLESQSFVYNTNNLILLQMTLKYNKSYT